MNNFNSSFQRLSGLPVDWIRRFANGRRALGTLTIVGGILAFAPVTEAGVASWTGASGTDTNWSDGANWSGGTGTANVPAAGDNVVFANSGNATTLTAINNIVDGTSGNFGGTIASLQYSNSNNFQNTLIAPGVTLSVTGSNSISDTLVVGTENVSSPVAVVTNSISGPGGTLIVSNALGNFMVSQSAAAAGAKAVLVMTNLDSLVVNVGRIGVGVSGKYGWFNNDSQTFPNGVLYLARTNIISTSFQGGVGSVLPPVAGYTNWASVYTLSSGREIEEAIEVGNGADNSASSVPSFLYLGQTNAFFIDSIGVGKSKSSAAGASMLFNPVFNNPTAYFRGTNGNTSRVTFWSVGDNATAGSTSNGALGTNDFTGGTIDILVDQMFLGIDKQGQTSASNPAKGTVIYTGGIINVNALTLGAQESSTTANLGPAVGVMTLNGANATLQVNSSLELGHTTISGNSALTSFGQLNVTNGTVCANNVIVGAVSTNNNISLNNATLRVTNSLATNAAGLALLSMANSTLGFTITDGSSKALVKTLLAGGVTNLVQLASVPVFASYPTQFVLVKYTTLNVDNFGLTNVPASTPGALLVSNGINSSIDLYLPVSPAPVITSQPLPFSGHPGDAFNLSVTNTGNPPLSYQWYYTNGIATNSLSDGTGPSGSSTLSGSTTNSLTMGNAQIGDSGGYFVVISNSFGVVTSSVVQVIISFTAIPPSITGLNNQTNIAGTTATISPSVSGSPVPTLQWQFNGSNLSDGLQGNGSTISGSAASTLTIANLQYPGSQGTYSLVASNSADVLTNGMVLTVIVKPSISGQPQSLVVTNAQSAAFTVVAGGVPDPTYQWYINSIANPILNATNATYSIAGVSPSDMGSYFAVVANTAGSISSSNATLTVNSANLQATAFSPANAATGICYDTSLSVTFNQAPVLNNLGTIRIYNITNSTTPVDTLDLSQGSPQSRTIGGVALNSYPVIIAGNTAAIYPHSGVMTSNQTYYVAIDGGVFKDNVGAYFAGVTNTSTWQFATKAGGPANPTNRVVAADGTGDFCTVQGAVDSVPNGNTIHTLINIRDGTYTEIVRLNSKNNVTFRGQDRHLAIVTYANWNGINPSSATRPMFGVLGANDVAIENLTLTNSTPNASGNNQAETLYVNVVKRFILYNADVDSYQDTLLVNASGDQAYVQDSHIQGNTDFIWGQGTLYATNAEIDFMSPQSSSDHLTQARTAQFTNGFAFVNCRLIAANNAVVNCDLGRDAGGTAFPYGQVAYINCSMDTNAIIPAGWVLGSGTSLAQTANLRFWEYQSTDLTGTNLVDVSQRASWSQQIDAATATNQVQNVTNWLYGWQPQIAPNILANPASLTVAGGQGATFTVSATGIPAPTYQWLKDSTNLIGQTGATLTIGSASGLDIGTYSVIVSNSVGSVTSSNAVLTVTSPTTPSTIASPSVTGGSVQFTINDPAGSAGFGYRVWATTNLALTPVTSTWTLLTNDVFGTGPIVFTDSSATGLPQRFYLITVP